MKILLLSLMLFLPFIARQIDPIAKTAALIGRGNVPELSKMFAPTVELTIGEDVNTYSNEQAETILTKFFTQNKPSGAHMLHKVNSGTNFLFGVVTVSTNNGNYRIAFTLKNVNNNNQLIELRIENEKRG
jgi:hypothetical protein